MNALTNATSITAGRRRAGAPIAALLLAAGCAAEVETQEGAGLDAEQQRLIDFLESHGYDTSDVRFEDDRIIVEGDIAFDRQFVNDGANGLEVKMRQGLGGQAAVSNVMADELWLDAPDDMSFEWAMAFYFAAARWNAVPNSNLLIGWEAPHQDAEQTFDPEWGKITLIKNAGLWPYGAEASFPSWGFPGPTIDYHPFMAEDFEDKLSLAMHEIGHTVGFAHCDEAQSQLVSGTQDVCVQDVSVMYRSIDVDPQSTSEPAITFSADELTGIASVY